MQTIRANWYAYPLYYDIAFGWDPAIECDFLEAVFRRFANGPVRRIYEPFVGTGRIAIELARRGYAVTGCDRLAGAIAFARARAAQAGVTVDLHEADVAESDPRRLSGAGAAPFDAVITLIDSFRHLTGPEQAARSAERFASCLRPGGVMVLAADVGSPPPEMDASSAWTMERDGVTVQTLVTDLRRPGATPGTSIVRAVLHVTPPAGEPVEIITDDEMRLYTLESLTGLFERHGLGVAGLFNREYDLEHAFATDNDPQVVAVFRRA